VPSQPEPEADFEMAPPIVEPGTVTIEWPQPNDLNGEPVAPAANMHYLIELTTVESSDPGGPPTRRFVTTDTTYTVTGLQPGRYRVSAVAIGPDGRWGRSTEREAEVLEPPTIEEAPVPPIEQCPPAETGDPTPGLCAPGPIEPDCPTINLRFERSMLMGYGGLDRSEWVPVDLTCTPYRVVLRSIDDGHAAGYQTNQTQERWYLEGRNANGDVIYISPAAPDLPDHKTEATIEFDPMALDKVVSFRARHLRIRNSADSIDVEADLIPAP
jgi:hypothetical protein